MDDLTRLYSLYTSFLEDARRDLQAPNGPLAIEDFEYHWGEVPSTELFLQVWKRVSKRLEVKQRFLDRLNKGYHWEKNKLRNQLLMAAKKTAKQPDTTIVLHGPHAGQELIAQREASESPASSDNGS